MPRLGFALKVLRTKFFSATVVPVLLGAALARWEGAFHLGYLLLTLLGALAVHAGLNMGNDYYDHLSGNDAAHPAPTAFGGGSRVIQEGLLSPRQILMYACIAYALGIAIGLYLAATRGILVLIFGMVGVVLAHSNNGPPLRLSYRGHGLGELAVGAGFGPLMVLGTYYVQTQRVSPEAWLASLPVAFLIMAVLYINTFPDVSADRAAHKMTPAVVWGRERAVWGYLALLALAYIAIIAPVAFDLLPPATLLALLTAPLAIRAAGVARRFHSQVPELLAANAATIQTHLASGLLLCLGYLLSGAVS